MGFREMTSYVKKMIGTILAVLLFVTFGLFWLANSQASFTSGIKPFSSRLANRLQTTSYNIPICSAAKNITVRDMNINGIDIKLIGFVTRKTVKKVINFYRHRLVLQGWKDLSSSLSDFPKEALPLYNRNNRTMLSGSNFAILFFSKEDKYVFVVIQQRPTHRMTEVLISIADSQIINAFGFPLTSGYSDAPGEDLEEVPRYPQSRRLLSRINETEQSRVTTLIYKSRSGVGSHYKFYRSAMKARGWQLSPLFERVNEESPGGSKILFFEKPGKGCLISIQRDRKTAYTMTLIKYEEQESVARSRRATNLRREEAAWIKWGGRNEE